MAPRIRLTGGPKEDELQASIATMLNHILRPPVIWSHFPSGGYYLTPAARARLYRLGLTRGWPDIMIALPAGKVLWLEVKSEVGRLEKEQVLRHGQLENLGHPVEVVRSPEDVVMALDRHGVAHRRIDLLGGSFGATQGHQGTAQVGPTGPA